MAYAGRWTKLWPSGAWQVWDRRLWELGESHTCQYIGYTKREAQQAHAQHVRELRKR
ncbi:hypothetical protein K0U83_08220 [bacterium]|jgi:hypothetical protein|nr:hypothetical protein [bacterium]